MSRRGLRERLRRGFRRWTAWPRKLGDSPQVAATSRLGWWAVAGGAAATLLIGGPLGLWLLGAGAVLLAWAGAQMIWRWVAIGDSLKRELAYDRLKDDEAERNRGLNRLQDRLVGVREPRATRALAGLRDLGARAVALERDRDRLAPADAEVLIVVERMRMAAVDTLERLASLRGSAAGRGGPGREDAAAADERMLAGVEEAVSRMAVAVGRLETRTLAETPRAAGGGEELDALSAELEGAMEVARRVEERVAALDREPGGSDALRR